MAFDIALCPREVPSVSTRYRTIKTPIPVPESIPLLKEMAACEPRSMGGQPSVIWDRAKDFSIWDPYGNRWIDFSSGVLVTNAGHAADEIVRAVRDQVDRELLHSYCFPNQPRIDLARKLRSLSPPPLEKVFLLTTGAEATECAFKLARTYGNRIGGPQKITMISFENAFHGRTLGAQIIGGIPSLKEWIVNVDPNVVQVPFPDGWRNTETDFSTFERRLSELGVSGDQVCGVITETYQGGMACFAPKEYIQNLRAWCDRHKALLIFDEVQAGFGRTGTFWGFEHYGVCPDMMCLGKGISSSLPLSAVVGRTDVMDLYGPGEMTSTHSANPVACRAALGSIERIEKDGLVEQAAVLGRRMHEELQGILNRHSACIGAVLGKGLVAGIMFVQTGTKEPAPAIAAAVTLRCVEKGVMLFCPVGPGGGTIKINPPLCISEEALMEGLEVFEEAVSEIETEMSLGAYDT
ncbi:MAG: aspartate aminotransferase family protein [bacterium]